MSSENPPNFPKYVLWIIIVLVLVSVVWYLVSSVTNSFHRMLSPLENTSNALNTQVAQVLHPTPTLIPDPVTIVHEVQTLARLETIQYTVEKVITAEENQGVFQSLFGDRLLFVAHGTVIAGVDLDKLTPADLVIKDNVLTVHLPDAEIFIATLDNQKSYIYDRQTGLLTHGDQNLETAARQAAENEIRQAALDDGILTTARQNAEVYLARLFQTLGFPNVTFLP